MGSTDMEPASEHEPMPPEPPRLPRAREELTADDLARLEDDAEVEGATIVAGDDPGAEALDLPGSSWEGVLLDRASLAGARLASMVATDLEATGADLSNVGAHGASVRRMRAIGTRALGIQLGEATLRSVEFTETVLDFANLRYAKLDRVTFVDCQLRDADLSHATLRSVRLERCDLTRCDLTGATFERCVLDGCTLDEVRGLGSLRGLAMPLGDVIELAPALAAALGMHVIFDA
jgi:uncharacterized protein YjbI with pentapeptide repeats